LLTLESTLLTTTSKDVPLLVSRLKMDGLTLMEMVMEPTSPQLLEVSSMELPKKLDWSLLRFCLMEALVHMLESLLVATGPSMPTSLDPPLELPTCLSADLISKL